MAPITLLDAAEAGNLELCRDFLCNGADINEPARHPPINAACVYGHLHIVRFLMEQGANLNGGATSAAFRAAECGHLEMCRLLVEAGSSIQKADSLGQTALMCCAANNHVLMCQFLLMRGADVNARSENGWTALMLAVLNDEVDAVKLLIASGADPACPIACSRIPPLTAFQMAVRENSLRSMQYFLSELGEDPAQRTIGGRTMPQLAGKHAEAKELLRSVKTAGAVSRAVTPDGAHDATSVLRRITALSPI